VLDVIATILSGGKSSRFYQGLVREKRLVLSADAEHSLLSRDPSLFYISADLLPGKEVAEVEKALDQEVERLQKEPVGEKELEKAKNQLEAAFIYGQDSVYYQAMLLAQHEISLDWRAIDNYLPSIRKVLAEDIQRVVKKYLVPDNRTIGILVPQPPKETKPMPSGPSIKEKMIKIKINFRIEEEKKHDSLVFNLLQSLHEEASDLKNVKGFCNFLLFGGHLPNGHPIHAWFRDGPSQSPCPLGLRGTFLPFVT
jgi:Zn-dependent M16 (insulinase) family peptidase